MESKLAIHGGAKAIKKSPKKYNSIGEAERFAVDSFFKDKRESVLFGYDKAAFIIKH